MISAVTSPDGIFTFGFLCGVIGTLCVVGVASELRKWDARNKR